MLKRLRAALKMAEGREELTKKKLTELKWAIYFVNCSPEKSNAIDETLDLVEGKGDSDIVKIKGDVQKEIEKWKGWVELYEEKRYHDEQSL